MALFNKNLQIDFLRQIESDKHKNDLADLNLKIFGRKGAIAKLTKKIKELPLNDRPEIGRFINETKKILEQALQNKKTELDNTDKLENRDFDPTLPAEKLQKGHLHITTYAVREIERIFKEIGFARRRYPEIETDWYAFESLNMPKNHPARDEWETFFIVGDANKKAKVDSQRSNQSRLVLTPHTSSGLAREMEKGILPIRMMNISKCYRRQIDICHIPMFHQFEGFVIDKKINFGHLKWTLEYFAQNFFGIKRKVRLRPSHFQFTEPSFEVDISCGLCSGLGCKYCKAGWSELGGAGMVHPNVLRAGQVDSKKYTGFAFGWGVERVYMMRQGLSVPDLRMLYENDLRFLEQF